MKATEFNERAERFTIPFANRVVRGPEAKRMKKVHEQENKRVAAEEASRESYLNQLKTRKEKLSNEEKLEMRKLGKKATIKA